MTGHQAVSLHRDCVLVIFTLKSSSECSVQNQPYAETYFDIIVEMGVVEAKN